MNDIRDVLGIRLLRFLLTNQANIEPYVIDGTDYCLITYPDKLFGKRYFFYKNETVECLGVTNSINRMKSLLLKIHNINWDPE